MTETDPRGIVERLGLPPSRRTATADQIESASKHAQELAQQQLAEVRQLRPIFDRLNLISTEYPDMMPEQVAASRPDLASEITEALRAELRFDGMCVDLADLAGWLGKPGISMRDSS
jgi:hypothetical protein